MPFVQSGGVVVGTPVTGTTGGNSLLTRPFGISVYGGLTAAYEVIYATQPNVRTVVSFLGRNMGQLRAKLYERVSDTERRYVRDHPLDRLMRRPNPRTSRYAFFRAVTEDLGVFDNHVSLKVRAAGRVALVRIPPQFVEPVGTNLLFPDGYRVTAINGAPVFPATDVLHLHGYNPTDPRWGLAPIETLRRLLAEDIAAGQYREQVWERGARINGVIQRPVDAPAWREAARDRFRQDFSSAFAGAGPEAGGTPILEDGMTWQNVTFTSQELEYLGARKLTRAEVAAAYHVDPSMVGMMDNANIANADNAHTRLYQDTLTPLTTFIEEEFTLQLLPEFEASEDALDRFYLEHNIDEKLRGDFITEAEAASRAVGAPWLTRNEQRARRNLPPVTGGDELITPLNVTTGGRASPADTAPGTPGLGQAGRPRALSSGRKALDLADSGFPAELLAFASPQAVAIATFVERQRNAVASRLGRGDTVAVAMGANDLGRFPRWDQELAELFGGYALEVAPVAAGPMAARFDIEYALDVATPWLVNNARIAAEGFNDGTFAALGEVFAGLSAGDTPTSTYADVFDLAAGARADATGLDRVTQVANFARHDAASQGGATTKTWTVTNARSRHPQLNGETVGLHDAFSNGGLWPRDPSLPSSETAGCQCLVDFTEADITDRSPAGEEE